MNREGLRTIARPSRIDQLMRRFHCRSAVTMAGAPWVSTVANWRMHTPAVIQVLAVVAIMAGLSGIILGIGLATFKRAVAGKSQ